MRKEEMLYLNKIMKKRIIFPLNYLSVSFLLLMSWSSVAYGAVDRDATPEEIAKVDNALKEAGCSSFDDVDFYYSLNLFKADDVMCNDGKKYDVYLDKNFKIVSKREDLD
ncbi:hypothetical protein C7H19_09315 [Aphanothece hegewaldii CCALA 016]|uniref:PepSY domain-containing protein n=1 Tax=Aphanothece hegewaldii CCALA 016 TaxID=2107694 RepID=A0A2T1LZG7_9CHRO|nr:hypothetical protein [Aphanothece hegewaldii]PSF37736.1 hypothetical protein C7H19_09315 [Aphanothece hegewaldii CCALA 016]